MRCPHIHFKHIRKSDYNKRMRDIMFLVKKIDSVASSYLIVICFRQKAPAIIVFTTLVYMGVDFILISRQNSEFIHTSSLLL